MRSENNRQRSGTARHVLYLVLLVALAFCSPASAQRPEDGAVCDVEADYALGLEDYAQAITLHLGVIQKHPGDALAHYHLGFAYGIVGRRDREREEYRDALSLGLVDWSLLLNLGLSYLDAGEFKDAADALSVAVLLAPERPEARYNLALVYERRAMLALAEQELLVTLIVAPQQPDARNMLAVIYGEEGNRSRAREEWSDLLRSNPDYEPAKTNLAILDATEAERTAAAKITQNAPTSEKADSFEQCQSKGLSKTR